MQLGHYDLNKFAKDGEHLTWLPLSSDDFWEFNVSGIKVGSHSIDTSTNKMFLDTGTTFTTMPESDYNLIAKQVFHDFTCF